MAEPAIRVDYARAFREVPARFAPPRVAPRIDRGSHLPGAIIAYTQQTRGGDECDAGSGNGKPGPFRARFHPGRCPGASWGRRGRPRWGCRGPGRRGCRGQFIPWNTDAGEYLVRPLAADRSAGRVDLQSRGPGGLREIARSRLEPTRPPRCGRSHRPIRHRYRDWGAAGVRHRFRRDRGGGLRQ